MLLDENEDLFKYLTYHILLIQTPNISFWKILVFLAHKHILNSARNKLLLSANYSLVLL